MMSQLNVLYYYQTYQVCLFLYNVQISKIDKQKDKVNKFILSDRKDNDKCLKFIKQYEQYIDDGHNIQHITKSPKLCQLLLNKMDITFNISKNKHQKFVQHLLNKNECY